MRPDFKYALGQEINLGSITTRITQRQQATFTSERYYRVTNDNRWHLESDIDYYEPLADWEKDLLADWNIKTNKYKLTT